MNFAIEYQELESQAQATKKPRKIFEQDHFLSGISR